MNIYKHPDTLLTDKEQQQLEYYINNGDLIEVDDINESNAILIPSMDYFYDIHKIHNGKYLLLTKHITDKRFIETIIEFQKHLHL